MTTERQLNKFEWNGWELDRNPFGHEFDAEARARMVSGADYLREFIGQFRLGKNILEVGPFFNPIMTGKHLSADQTLVYLENDQYAIEWLQRDLCQSNIAAINYDINTMTQRPISNLLPPRFSHIKTFDTVVLSQVLNYIDYVNFYEALKSYLNPGARIYVNNVVDYGIPAFFHEKRPKSISETLMVLLQLGFTLVQQELKPPPREQDDNRLLLCVEYVGE